MDTFDLIDAPWVPCRGRDGAGGELGLLPVLARAHELAGISGDVATQTFALTRLLLAVLHGALAGPRDLGEWRTLWDAETLPADRIGAYLDQHRNRFDLFHPETPFLQVADLRNGKGEASELSKLIADVPNGVRFFTSRQGELSLSYAEAARWVVHVHAFDTSGIKTGCVGDPRVSAGKTFPIGVAWGGLLGGVLLAGATLKETLLLNLMSRDFPDYARDPAIDRPVWERPQVTAAEEEPGGRAPTGPVDLYVWQSRRVRLFPTGGRVTQVLLGNGEPLAPHNRFDDEPHTAWRRSEAQEKLAKRAGKKLDPDADNRIYMPREHDPDRLMWRDLPALLPAQSSGHTSTSTSDRWLSPGIMEWLGHLSDEELVATDFPVEVQGIGMIYGPKGSTTTDIVHDTLRLPAGLAARGAQTLADVVVDGVRSAELATQAVGGLAGDLVAAAGGDGDGPRSRTMDEVYPQLDPLFRRWLLTVTAGTRTDTLRVGWERNVFRIVRGVADDLLRNIPPAYWQGRMVRGQRFTAAHAEARYRQSLRLALPTLFPAEEVDQAGVSV